MNKSLLYCPECNHALTRIEWEQAAQDFACPNCGKLPLSSFYSYGSDTHKRNWEDHRRYRKHPDYYKVPVPFEIEVDNIHPPLDGCGDYFEFVEEGS